MTAETPGSYRIGERAFREAGPELERLRIQARLAWPQELRTLELHGLRADSIVLEAGCGPGFVTELLLGHVQEGSVTGLDVDSTLLAHAREFVGEVERVHWVEATVTETGLPDDAFDVVIARFLLQHVPEREAAVAELRRVLRPGGRLILVDSDFAFSNLFDPEPAFGRDLMEAVARSHALQGGDGHMGRRLPRLLRDAGFSDLALDAVVAHSVLVGREPIRGVIPDQALDHMQAAGLISAELARDVRAYLARIDAGDEDVEGMVSFLVASGAA